MGSNPVLVGETFSLFKDVTAMGVFTRARPGDQPPFEAPHLRDEEETFFSSNTLLLLLQADDSSLL